MNSTTDEHPRTIARVEAPNCACGFVGHMTADELKQRAANDDMDLSCPVCGLIHLSREEIEDLEQQKVVNCQTLPGNPLPGRGRELRRRTSEESCTTDAGVSLSAVVVPLCSSFY